MNMVLGGMRTPSVPPAAMHPVASFRSYPRLFNSGSAITPMVAAEARLDPVQAAKAVQARFVARAIPPGALPTDLYAASKSSRLIPELYANWPIRINSGSATMT